MVRQRIKKTDNPLRRVFAFLGATDNAWSESRPFDKMFLMPPCSTPAADHSKFGRDSDRDPIRHYPQEIIWEGSDYGLARCDCGNSSFAEGNASMDVRAPFDVSVFDSARICLGEDLQWLIWNGGFCR